MLIAGLCEEMGSDKINVYLNICLLTNSDDSSLGMMTSNRTQTLHSPTFVESIYGASVLHTSCFACDGG